MRWAKTILHDAQLKVLDDTNDQWGNGDLDEGEPNGLGGNTLDMCGTSTPADANDDLEIVDEVSFEDGQGWEYDTDDRHVDANSTFAGLPHRHVHALDDPADFNPDALSRVDYRTKGTAGRQGVITAKWPTATTGRIPPPSNGFAVESRNRQGLHRNASITVNDCQFRPQCPSAIRNSCSAVAL